MDGRQGEKTHIQMDGWMDGGEVRGKAGEGAGVGEAPVLVPTDTLLQLIQIRVSKTGRLNLQASQQYRDCCQDQSLTLHTHTHCSNLLCANQVPPAAPHRTPLNSPPAPAPNYQPGWDSHPLEHCTVRDICLTQFFHGCTLI